MHINLNNLVQKKIATAYQVLCADDPQSSVYASSRSTFLSISRNVNHYKTFSWPPVDNRYNYCTKINVCSLSTAVSKLPSIRQVQIDGMISAKTAGHTNYESFNGPRSSKFGSKYFPLTPVLFLLFCFYTLILAWYTKFSILTISSTGLHYNYYSVSTHLYWLDTLNFPFSQFPVQAYIKIIILLLHTYTGLIH